MFKVEVDNLEDYLAFDPARRADLEALAQVIEAGTGLKRYFHAGTPAGQPGMRFRMVGFGRQVKPGGLEWPLIGVALQKNYISVYLDGGDLGPWVGRLGRVKAGPSHFSFARFQDLDQEGLRGMLGQFRQG